jgi:dimethylhistidine N-methyltransferase
MRVVQHEGITLYDYEPRQDFAADVAAGLSRPPGAKSIPSKYLYDERGSQLFEAICALPEYYLTRTELSILRAHLPEMAQLIGPRAAIVEPGAGAGIKTRLLLEHLEDPVAYVPVDISRELLVHTARTLNEAFPQLEVLPICADYHGDWELPPMRRTPARTAAFFPGSTVGNMEPDEAARFLKRLARVCSSDGGILIGVDLRKDPALIAPAYDDAQGVTRAFNVNLIARLNRELGADIPSDAFRHVTLYNEAVGRNESYLEAKRDVTIKLDRSAGPTFTLATRERVQIEHSYKYSLEGFAQLAAAAGLLVSRVWADADGLFSVQYLTRA